MPFSPVDSRMFQRWLLERARGQHRAAEQRRAESQKKRMLEYDRYE